MSEINAAELKKAVKEFNEKIVGTVDGVDKIRTVGISTKDMAIQFINACNVVSEVDENLLTDSMVEVYNTLPDPDVIAASKEEDAAADKKAPKADKPPKAEKPPKAPKPPKEPKAPKKVIEKSRYGHVQSAKSGALDDLLFEGHTVKEIMEALDVTKHRVIGHANHLKDDFSLTLLTKVNEKDPLENHLKIKEAKYVPPSAAETKEEEKPAAKKKAPPVEEE